MQSYKKEGFNYRQLLQLTSLEADEFMSVLSVFDMYWQGYHQHHDLKGDKRKLPKFKEHALISLEGSHDKLLFVLIYLKQNPTQYYHGALFKMSQGKVSQWLKLLLPLLAKTLDHMKLLPARSANELYASLKVVANYLIFIDGTERPIPRPVDKEKQHFFYSGKKRGHTIKNNLIVNDGKKILYLSPTVEGKMHDKALAEETELHFPPTGLLMQDLGFLGFAPDNVEVLMPVKKPRNQELTLEEKAYNQFVSSIRVKVEHAIGSCKRLRIVLQKIRLRIEDIQDLVILIATGLHNLRITHRNLS
jgi:hypothetical protein